MINQGPVTEEVSALYAQLKAQVNTLDTILDLDRFFAGYLTDKEKKPNPYGG